MRAWLFLYFQNMNEDNLDKHLDNQGEFNIEKLDFSKLMEQGLKNSVAEEVEEEATEEEAEEPVIPTETLKVMDVIPVNIERVYKNWLNSEKHSAFTGGKARIKPVEESDFSAWDTYIVGEILELDYAKRIYTTWRSDDFPPGHPNSKCEVLFEEHPRGTLITINHTGIPMGQKEDYMEGWVDNYFAPMKEYYNRFK